MGNPDVECDGADAQQRQQSQLEPFIPFPFGGIHESSGAGRRPIIVFVRYLISDSGF